ncbi:MAG: hypothetical protein CL489_05720 [Acidobacteria bacterium]|nr:hypothetical protein [Acidobacteriota bacterium]
MYHNDWFDYDYKDFKVNEYPNLDFRPTTFEDALVRQAKTIYNDLKPALFVSGGIDSQAMALGFILAELDVEYIYIRPCYNGYYNKQDYFFVTQFCNRHNINLKIIDLEFNKNSLRDFLLEQNFFNTGTGSGTIFLLEGIRRYEGDGFPITADGHLIFDNTNSKCRGLIKKPGLGLSHGMKMENQILFDYYYNYMYQYYEHMHKTTPELQYLTKMEAKNLIYTQLGFPLRPKLSGWEFLDEAGDYPSLSVLDWSNDHSKYARLTRGINIIVEKLGISEDFIKHKLGHQEKDSDRWITLYEFEPK